MSTVIENVAPGEHWTYTVDGTLIAMKHVVSIAVEHERNVPAGAKLGIVVRMTNGDRHCVSVVRDDKKEWTVGKLIEEWIADAVQNKP